MNKRGQVTIFIIIAIIIVVAIVGVYILTKKTQVQTNILDNPQSFLEKCISDSVKESEDIIFNSNGFPENNFKNYMLYKKEKIPFMCTSSEFYSACIPQEPMFINKIENIMSNKVNRDYEECTLKIKKEVQDKGYGYKEEKTNFSLSIRKDFIYVNINKKIFISKNEFSKELNKIDVKISSKLYNILKLEQVIVNYESTICEFDYLNWMLQERELSITRDKTSDQTKIYTIEDQQTDKQIKFAVKTCILPAGL